MYLLKESGLISVLAYYFIWAKANRSSYLEAFDSSLTFMLCFDRSEFAYWGVEVVFKIDCEVGGGGGGGTLLFSWESSFVSELDWFRIL